MDTTYYADRKAYRKWRRLKFREQKLMGWAMVVMNLLVPTGAAVLLIPMGLWLAFSRQILIY